MVPLLQTTTESYYKRRQLYYNLKQKFITYYIKNLSQITAAQISAPYWWVLQRALTFLLNYGSSQNYYKLCQNALQITAGATICSVITNCNNMKQIKLSE